MPVGFEWREKLTHLTAASRPSTRARRTVPHAPSPIFPKSSIFDASRTPLRSARASWARSASSREWRSGSPSLSQALLQPPDDAVSP